MTKLKIFFAGAALLFLGACSSVNMVENAGKSGQKRMVDDIRVTTDPGLTDIAYVAGINESLNANGLKTVQVELVNRTESERNVNYRFEWTDKSGMLIENPAPVWITISIDAGESRYISSTSPSVDASDFRLKLLGTVRPR